MANNTKFVQMRSARLRSAIDDTATECILQEFVGLSGEDITQADFGTKGWGTFEPNTDREEAVEFVVTANTDGIATLTLIRGLRGKAPYGAGGTAFAHQAGSEFVVSNNPDLFNKLTAKDNDETITASWKFPNPPVHNLNPATKEYVDNLTEPAVTIPVVQAAHGLVAGDVIRVSAANTYVKAQANTASGAEVAGYVTEVIDANSFEYISEGLTTVGVPAFPAGTVVFLSRTVAGALTDTDTTTVGEMSAPLGIIIESGAKMVFHRYRPAMNNIIPDYPVPVASETVAGVVEQATAAELAEGAELGDSGAPLFVSPKDVSSSVFSFTASEDISSGDLLARIHKGLLQNKTLDFNTMLDKQVVGNTIWRAQSFFTSADAVKINRLQITVLETNGSGSGVVRMRVRASLSGPDLYVSAPFGWNGSSITFTVDPNLDVDPNTEYFLILDQPSFGSDSPIYCEWYFDSTKPYAAGTTYTSTNSGAAWSAAENNKTYSFNVTESQGVVNTVVKASAESQTTRLNLIGYALTNATKGNSVIVNTSNLIKGSGFSAGSMYYLSDTLGAKADTPGTISRQLGIALSPTVILRKFGAVTPEIPMEFNPLIAPAPGFISAGTAGSGMYINVDGFNFRQDNGGTRPFDAGESISFSKNTGTFGHIRLYDYGDVIGPVT